MQVVQFLSDAWIAALDQAARDRVVPDVDPLADVVVSIEHRITDGPSWRLEIDHGAVRVTRQADHAAGEAAVDAADVRMTSDRATARAIARGDRAALEAFIHGDLALGGDVRILLAHRASLEILGDLFAAVKADTDLD